MSHHIPDVTKMISDTPRTDEAQFGTGRVSVNFACQLERELNSANDRIKRLEQELMEVKNKHAVLVADVVLNEDRGERIKQLEDRIHRASMAFFRDGSDGHVASQMLQILEEERGKP